MRLAFSKPPHTLLLLSLSLLPLVACTGGAPANSPSGSSGEAASEESAGSTGVGASISMNGATNPNGGPAGAMHAFTATDMLSFDRISDPSLSPDGKMVVFTVSTPDAQANTTQRDIWLAATDGSFAKRMTSHPAADMDGHFSADGRSIYFLSSRSGSTQVWRIAVDGGEATQVTHLPVGVEAIQPFPESKRLLLAIGVYPDARTLEDTAKRDQAAATAKENVRAYDQLPVRHWDTWDDGKRSHLFVWSDDSHPPTDLLAGLPYDSPMKPFGEMNEVAISKDGKEVVFTAKMVGREGAWSTNSDLWVVNSDGTSKPRSITAGNLATDTQPVFSHDGTKLAYLAMARPGFEADIRRIVIMDWKSKQSRTLTGSWDRSPEELAWSKDDKTLFTTADNFGRRTLFGVNATTGAVTTWLDQGSTEAVHPSTGSSVLFEHDDLEHPTELWTSSAPGVAPHAVTHLNDARAASIAWSTKEQFTFTGAKGDTVYGWVVKPSGLAPGAKVPVAFLIHGGPQGSFGDHFHYRWNAEAFAGHGYAAIMIDFHGSTGYGQAFTDAIRDDWGGAPFEDLMKGLDAALVKYPFLDKDRVAALGASYGGFMINWVNGHTDRFRALVCHDGNLDERMAYFATEELWFPEWEHKGLPWENGAGYAKQNPIDFVSNWKTPTLVVHGGRDYRVVDTEGLATFTALQRKNVPSRFVYFPEENHWVLAPANSKRWHEEVLGWLDKWTKSR